MSLKEINLSFFFLKGEINLAFFFEREINLACHNMKMLNIYTYDFNQNKKKLIKIKFYENIGHN